MTTSREVVGFPGAWGDEPEGEWSARQLAGLLDALAGHSDPVAATEHGLEQLAEILGAKLVALVRQGCDSITSGDAELPDGLIDRLAAEDLDHVMVPPIGVCVVAREPLDDERLEWLIAVRPGARYSPAELGVLGSGARALGLVREMLARRRLLERASEIQRQLMWRTNPEEMLSRIVAVAAELTGSDIGILREAESGADSIRDTGLVASVGLDRVELAEVSGVRGQMTTQRVMEENRLVVVENYSAHPGANEVMAASGLESVMGAPVREGEMVAGALLVGSRRAGRRFSVAERSALETFAEHASLALNDARVVADAVHRSLHDPLTGLPNRDLLADRLEQALGRAERQGTELAVLFIDIDRFKTVNDSLGHSAGDELLVAAASRLSRCIRPGDTVARLGGDEFAVLVEDADERVGGAVAGRVQRALSEPFTLGTRSIALGASIGIATARTRSDDPMQDGDLAMYRAKAEGRGRSSVFRPAMRERARDRLELESELRGAEARGELVLDYQPIVELGGGRTVMAEALLRWEHPVRGRLPPAAFLDMAEETREIGAVGRWVTRAACAQARAWVEDARGMEGGVPAPWRVAINVSAFQLHHEDFVGEVRDAVRLTGIAPERLAIELTETVLMEDVDSSLQRLRSLADLGVAITVDNFGTGYCSLQYLNRFPIDYLKIARPFISDVAGDAAGVGLVRALADVGAACGLTVIAEGIETPEQQARLHELGVGLGQGFLFAPPLGAGDVEQRLRAA